MKRREFLKGAAGIIAGAVVAVPLARAAVPYIHDALIPFWERGWDWSIIRIPTSMFWNVFAEFKPNGVRYGWAMSDEYLAHNNLTPETFLLRQLGRANPNYVEETMAGLSK